MADVITCNRAPGQDIPPNTELAAGQDGLVRVARNGDMIIGRSPTPLEAKALPDPDPGEILVVVRRQHVEPT